MVAESGTIEIIDTVRSGVNPLNDVRGADTIKIGGNRFFATSSETQDRFSVFAVDTTGGFTFVDGATADGAYGLSFAKVGGSTFLIGAGRANDTLYSYSVTSAGVLTEVNTVADAGALNLDDQQSAPAVITVEGTTFVVQSGFADDGISVFSLSGTGLLTNRFNIDDADASGGTDFALDGVQAVTAFEANGQAYVAAAGNASDGVGLFSLNGAGQLAFVDSVFDTDADASGLVAPIAIAHAKIGGRTFLFSASDGVDGIATIEVKANGNLKHQSNFFGVGTTAENLDLDVVQVGGLTVLMATDRSFGTVTAFVVDDAGRLQLLSQNTDTADAGSAHQGAFGIAGFAEDQRLFALVSAQVEDAISLFEVGRLSDSISGQSGDDILVGFGGNDDFAGLGGDDLLYGLAGSDRLLGGQGKDALFGGRQSDILLGQAGADDLGGGDGADSLFGGDGADTVHGGNGADLLRGGRGADRLVGGNGSDDLGGKAGNDTLLGGSGVDTLAGNDGRDFLNGGMHSDVLQGGQQNDRLSGAFGDDTLNGGAGADVLFGGKGDDRLNGATGNDTMTGNAGADRFQILSFRDGERDVIRDFQDGVDLIDINVAVSFLKEQQGDDLLLTFQGSGHQILFHDLDSDDLTNADFG